MPVIRQSDTRRTETPNAVMTTLASPTQGGSSSALWRVDMAAGNSGPVHHCDAEQIWTILTGRATFHLDGTPLDATEGDTVILPAETARRISAGPRGYTALVTAPGGATVRTPDGGDPIVPAWMA